MLKLKKILPIIGLSLIIGVGAWYKASLATITDTDVKTISALGNGSNTNFTIGFQFQDNDELVVYLQEEGNSPYMRTPVVFGSGAGKYTVTGGDPGTTVVMGTAPTTTQRVVIVRNTPKTQTVDYVETEAFPSEDHEEQMDRMVQAIQEISSLADTKVGLSTSSTSTAPVLYDPVENKILAYDSGASTIISIPSGTLSSGIIPLFNGSNWVTFNLSSALAGLPSLATITSGTAGTDFNVDSSNPLNIKINLPSASATNRGAITTGTQTIAGNKTLSGDTLIGGSTNQVGPANFGSTITVASLGTFTTRILGKSTLSIEDPGSGTSTVSIVANQMTAPSYQVTLPPAQGGQSTVMVNDGSGMLGWQTISSLITGPRGEVGVSTGNGHGAVNTKIRRFTSITKNSGTAITYADSANNGASFTINENGLYTIDYSDNNPASAALGISVNATLLTTSILSINYAQGKRANGVIPLTDGPGFVSWTGELRAGDVVRPHTDGGPNDTSSISYFTITKIAN